MENNEVKEVVVLRGKDALKDTCMHLGIKLGKKKQTKSLKTNANSKQYDNTIAKRRAKEKNRREANRKTRQ